MFLLFDLGSLALISPVNFPDVRTDAQCAVVRNVRAVCAVVVPALDGLLARQYCECGLSCELV